MAPHEIFEVLRIIWVGLMEARACQLWVGWGYQAWFEAPFRYFEPSFKALLRVGHYATPEFSSVLAQEDLKAREQMELRLSQLRVLRARKEAEAAQLEQLLSGRVVTAGETGIAQLERLLSEWAAGDTERMKKDGQAWLRAWDEAVMAARYAVMDADIAGKRWLEGPDPKTGWAQLHKKWDRIDDMRRIKLGRLEKELMRGLADQQLRGARYAAVSTAMQDVYKERLLTKGF